MLCVELARTTLSTMTGLRQPVHDMNVISIGVIKKIQEGNDSNNDRVMYNC